MSEGGTIDPMDGFIADMGRKPDPNALYRREGLLPPEDEKKVPKPATPRAARP